VVNTLMRDLVVAGEDLGFPESVFPSRLGTIGHDDVALKGLRQDKSARSSCCAPHVARGLWVFVRETAVRARESGLADLSDVALLKRLRKCEQWLYALGVGLWQQRGPSATARRSADHPLD